MTPPPDADSTDHEAGKSTSSHRLRWLFGPLVVALLCSSILTLTHLLTSDAIAENEQQQSLRTLTRLLENSVDAEALMDVDWSEQTHTLCLPRLLITRSQGDGYAGEIKLLLAVTLDEPPTLAGVAVTAHQETPGIADFLNDASASSWLASLHNATAATIAGVDSVTGATISSRAVRATLAKALRQAPEQGCAP